MGLFKKADEIAYLRNKIESLTDEYLRLGKENDILRGKLKATQNFVDSTPSDCTPGKWCAACEFSRCFIYLTIIFILWTKTTSYTFAERAKCVKISCREKLLSNRR